MGWKRGETRRKRGGGPQRLAGLTEALQPQFQLQLLGPGQLVVEGYRGILEYRPELIRLALPGRMLQVQGESLTMKCMTGESMILEGRITGLNLVE